MIAACPDCGARYRIDPAKLPAGGARLRCTRCQGVFRVEAPTGESSPAAAAAPAPQAAPAAQPPGTASSEEPAPTAGRSGASSSALDVVIAHSDAGFAERVGEALTGWGIRARATREGVPALLGIQRVLPKLVLLEASLPGMSGLQICELMQRNEQLRSISVVVVGTSEERAGVRESYGPDAFLEAGELPAGLRPLLEAVGLKPAAGTEPAPGASPEAAPSAAANPASPAAPPAPVAAPTPPVPPSAGAPSTGSQPDAEKAERLARIIVSDVILYNPELFEAGLRKGNVVEALANEVEEGVALFEQRMGSDHFDARQMLHGELERQARARGGA